MAGLPADLPLPGSAASASAAIPIKSGVGAFRGMIPNKGAPRPQLN